jgi:hypothetical protein
MSIHADSMSSSTKEIDALKLEATHTIDMARFVDKAEIDARYWEKPYYLLPDGDAGEEGYAVLRDALAETGKVAVGQLIMTGREHLIGIRPLGRGRGWLGLNDTTSARGQSRVRAEKLDHNSHEKGRRPKTGALCTGTKPARASSPCSGIGAVSRTPPVSQAQCLGKRVKKKPGQNRASFFLAMLFR